MVKNRSSHFETAFNQLQPQKFWKSLKRGPRSDELGPPYARPNFFLALH